MHWDTLKQGNYSTVREDGGSRVSEIQAGTTSPMPEHKGTVTVRDPPNHTSSLRAKESFVLACSEHGSGKAKMYQKHNLVTCVQMDLM